MLLEVLLVLPIYVIFFAMFWKFSHIIKAMDELDRLLDVVDTPQEAIEQGKKREVLQHLVESGEGSKIPGKTPWTRERLQKASDKVINRLYAKISGEETKKNKDLMSRVAGVDDVQAMMKDINSNYLIKSRATEMMGKLTPTISLSTNTPMEIVGSHLYEKCGAFLAPMSLVCTVFNHLDWETFARIAEERRVKEECVSHDHLAATPDE